jgi:hypothetical protein
MLLIYFSFRESEIRKVNLEPNLQNLHMEFWGLPPTMIIEIAASALGFWEYQKKQELAWNNHTIQQKDKKLAQAQQASQEKLVILSSCLPPIRNSLI